MVMFRQFPKECPPSCSVAPFACVVFQVIGQILRRTKTVKLFERSIFLMHAGGNLAKPHRLAAVESAPYPFEMCFKTQFAVA